MVVNVCSIGVLFARCLLMIVTLTTLLQSSLYAQNKLTSLWQVFSKGYLLQDRNSDDVIDFIHAKIIVADEASPADSLVAAHVAARLGFETMGINLPLTARDSETMTPDRPYVVLIGQRNKWVQKLVTEGQLDLSSLNAGEGMVTLIESALDGSDALVIAGKDDEGTLAAGYFLAARMPYVWRVGKETLKKVEEDVTSLFRQSGIAQPNIAARTVVVNKNEDEMKSLVLSVAFSSTSELSTATKLLQDVASAHERKEQGTVLNYSHLGILTFELTCGNEKRRVNVKRVGDPPKKEEIYLVRESREPVRDLSLANIYSLEGLLKGSQTELIPNRVDTTLVVGRGKEAIWAADIAARLGLESTGIRFPLVKTADEITGEKSDVNSILIGKDNRFVQSLVGKGKLSSISELKPNQGLIEVVPEAFEESPALVVAGNDEAGTKEAAHHLASRVPYLWENRKGQLNLAMIEDEARKFFAARSGAGQAAAAMYKLDKIIAKEFIGKELESVDIKVYVENADDGFARFLDEYLRPKVKADKVEIKASSIDVFHSSPVFEESLEIPWEVNDFWSRFRSQVLPKVKKSSQVELEVRVSEAPEVRLDLEKQIRAELKRKGLVDNHIKVAVLSAYKQGFSWLNDVVLPPLKEKSGQIAQIKIKFAMIEQGKEKPELRWQTIFSPIRWLQELYPIDEVLAKELKIPLEAITFEKSASQKGAIYEVEVRDKSGSVLYKNSFDPKFVISPLFKQFPDYESVRVTTGWVTAKVNGRAVLDERIVTDPEKFWDHYQSKTLPRIFGYVMDLYEGKPKAEHAPYFSELKVDLVMSEPDYQLGIDQEQISSLEALHEDIYFETLAFFDLLGLKFVGERLSYPGRIIPLIHPPRHSQNGQVKILFTGKAAGNPKVVVEWKEKGKEQKEKRSLDIWKVAVEDPRTAAAVVEAGHEGVRRLDLLMKVDNEKDMRDELIKRATEENVDKTILSAEQALAMIENLSQLHQTKLFAATLSYPKLDEIRFRIVSPEKTSLSGLPNMGLTYQVRDISASAKNYKYGGERIVQWESPINPEECEEIVAKLNTFPEVNAYHAGRSYLGRDIWAMDFMLPVEAKLWSQAKASTFKPVLFISGRQHANEVSSTSHILRLGELIVTDPEYKKYLKKVNLVLHPITNPDGAALAYELQKITPDFMLHAGYLGSLGVDVTTGQWDRDPMYPETKVRREVWRTWLPDIYLNPHGYPSHEWVQLFAGYAAWVRSRTPEQGRTWWSPRGWFIPGFSYIQDPRYPKHKEVAFAIRDYIADAINSDARVRQMNQRMYTRYRKYGVEWDPKTYKEDFHKGVRIYTAIKGSKQSASSTSFMVRYPGVTVLEGSTEAPDETARGAWLELVTAAGLQFDLAHLRFLSDAQYEVKRTEEEFVNGIRLSVSRKRPVLPPARKDSETKKP